MFCTTCGKENPDSASFCYACGASIRHPVPREPGPASPASTEGGAGALIPFESTSGSARIFVLRPEGQQESYSLEEVNALLQRGELAGNELAWRAGISDWRPLSELEGISIPAVPPLPVSARPGLGAHRPLSNAWPPTTPASDVASTQSLLDGPVGIGGWLRFFIISVGILSPLATGGQLMRSWEQLSPYFSRFPALKSFLIPGFFGAAVIVVLGIVVSILLEKAPPNGRQLAFGYLGIRFIGSMLMTFVQYSSISDLPPQILNPMASELFGGIVRESLILIVWGLYFSRSRRVRNTFVARQAGVPE